MREPNAGHRQRLRDKFLEHGLEKLTDEEIVELLLTFGTPRRDCKQAARKLLERFGTIRGVFEAERGDLAAIDGIGQANIVAIRFINEVAGRYLEQRLIGRDYLSSSAKVFAYLRHHMENLDKEVFKVIFLDGANGIQAMEDAGAGTVGSAYVHTREIIERAMVHRAGGLVFAHNHPSGKTQPSPDDYRLTRMLVHAAFLVEMKVVDHLIVGREETYYSFRDHGHLSRYEGEVRRFYASGG